MQSTSRFEALLRKSLEERINEIKDELVEGLGVDDYSKYRQRVGEVQGLKRALEECDFVNQTLNENRA